MDRTMILQLCRLCATQHLDSTSVSAENKSSLDNARGIHLQSLVRTHLGIKITDHKSLPKQICSECIQKLHLFQTFFQRCHAVQEMFTSLAEGNRLTIKFKKLKPNQTNFTKESTVVENVKSSDSDSTSYNNRFNNGDRISLREHSNNEFLDMCNVRNESNELETSMSEFSSFLLKAVEWKEITFKDNSQLSMPSIITANEKIKSTKKKNIFKKTQITNESLELQPTTEINFENVNDDINNDPVCGNVKEVQESFTKSIVKTNNQVSNDVTEKLNEKFTKDLSTMFQFNCHICKVEFKFFTSLSQHCKKEHNSWPTVNCICGKQLHCSKAINNHYRLHKGIYRCNTCKKEYNDESSFHLHMDTHKLEKTNQYVCCKCALSFSSIFSLLRHEKIHLPIEERLPVICDMCQKRFAYKTEVRKHIRRVHLHEKSCSTFICDKCGKSCASKYTLTAHLIRHSSLSPWSCEVCGAGFTAKHSLYVHMQKHNGIKFGCPHCYKEFSSESNLKCHLVIHKEEFPHVCRVCLKPFRRPQGLKNHMNQHTGLRPYRCPVCDRSFASSGNFCTHKRKLHPEIYGIKEDDCKKMKLAISEVILMTSSSF